MTNKFSARAFFNMWHTLALVPYALIMSLSIWVASPVSDIAITANMSIMLHAAAALFLLLMYKRFNTFGLRAPIYPVAIILHAVTICLTLLSWNSATIIAAMSMLLSMLLVIEHKRQYIAYDGYFENDRQAWLANREFGLISTVLAFVYAVMFIAIVIWYKISGNAIWKQSALMFVSVIYITLFIEFFRALYAERGKCQKHAITPPEHNYDIVYRHINTKGKSYRSKRDFPVIAIRIIVLEGKSIYLKSTWLTDREAEVIDTPFTSQVIDGEHFNEYLENATRGILDINQLRFVTKYRHTAALGDMTVLLYLYNMRNSDIRLEDDGGRFWSMEEIASAKPGEISDILLDESDFLNNTIFGNIE